MSKELFKFHFKNSKTHKIRTLKLDDNSIWFIAVDVCMALDIRSDTIRKIVDNSDIKDINPNVIGVAGGRNPLIISESGLYQLIFKSRKPEAKKFCKWVTADVLPQIRKTGAYFPNVPASPRPIIPINENTAPDMLQKAMNLYFSIETAANKQAMIMSDLKNTRKQISGLVKTMFDTFPDAKSKIDLMETAN